MRQLLTRNLGWKIMSLALAVVLWLAIEREPEVATSLSVPVEFKNMRDDLDISGDLPDRIHIEVRGSSGRLSRDNLSAVAAVLDLSDAQAGERTYSVRGRNLNLPSGVVFYRAVPSQITMRFEQLVARELPVTAVLNNLPAGYRVTGQETTPAKVRIRGPLDHVQNLNRVKTDPVDLTGVAGEEVFHTHLHIGDPQVRLENPPEVTVRVMLQKVLNAGAN